MAKYNYQDVELTELNPHSIVRSKLKIDQKLKLVQIDTYGSSDRKFDKVSQSIQFSIEDLIKVLSHLEKNTLRSNPLKILQKIICGPPGTGKSYKINQELKEKGITGSQTIRMVCHPESTNAQFIGSYRPQSIKGQITYGFSEGPFTKLLKRALNNPDQPYVLVIEELNRANSAAMFAEAFQLLDRDANGWSEHPTDLGDDVLSYLLCILGEDHKEYQRVRDEGVRLPPNFAIWATMNTADQGVFPMDTAFKRRWSFEYIGVDEGHEEWLKPEWNPEIPETGMTWQTLRLAINSALELEGIEEDRYLGGFFLTKQELADPEQILNHVINKVIGYLRDDVVRYEPERLFKMDGDYVPGFAKLRRQIKKYPQRLKSIFKDDLQTPLITALNQISQYQIDQG